MRVVSDGFVPSRAGMVMGVGIGDASRDRPAGRRLQPGVV